MASRTFGSAAMNLWYYGIFSLLGLSTLALWCLSPLMQQPLARMIFKEPKIDQMAIDLKYVDTSLGPALFSSSPNQSTTSIEAPVTEALISASLLTATASQAGMIDLWLNPKSPLLPPSSGSGWQDFDAIVNGTCASLLGVPVAGLPSPGNASYLMESTYMSLACSPLQNIIIPGNSSAWKFVARDQNFLVNYTAAVDKSTAIQFASRFPAMFWNWTSKPNANTSYVQTSCNVSWTHVESSWSCVDQRCMVDQVRQSQKVRNSPAQDASQYNDYLPGLLQAIAYTNAGDRRASIVENYLFNPDHVLEPNAESLKSFSFEDFAARLARESSHYSIHMQ